METQRDSVAAVAVAVAAEDVAAVECVEGAVLEVEEECAGEVGFRWAGEAGAAALVGAAAGEDVEVGAAGAVGADTADMVAGAGVVGGPITGAEAVTDGARDGGPATTTMPMLSL